MLRVVGWDDPRCLVPLDAALSMWARRTGVEYEILVRPLTAFNDQPIIELSSLCDVMVIDHPHIPDAVATNAVVPLDELIKPAALDDIRRDAIGANFDCYVVDGRPYALHADAACHVSAFRPHILARYNEACPHNFDDLIALARRHPGSVAWPLYHTDAISSFLSLLAGAGFAPRDDGRFIRDEQTAIRLIEMMAALSRLVPDFSWDCTPKAMFDRLSGDDAVGYIPFAFSYMRMYLRDGGDDWVFGAPPGPAGSTLGGAGMAVSSRASNREEAGRFIAWYCAPETLVSLVEFGAQSGGRLSWTAHQKDPRASQFFKDVRPLMEGAWVRPKLTWWPKAQIAAGEILVDGLRSGRGAHLIVEEIEASYARVRADCEGVA